MKPVDALAGRFRVDRRAPPHAACSASRCSPRASPAGWSATDAHRQLQGLRGALAKVKETGGYLAADASRPGRAGPARRVLLVAAIVTLAPTVIARLARVGRARCPSPGASPCATPPATAIAPGPTTSAIAVAVAGSVVLACVLAATSAPRSSVTSPRCRRTRSRSRPARPQRGRRGRRRRGAATALPGGSARRCASSTRASSGAGCPTEVRVRVQHRRRAGRVAGDER